MGLSPGLDEPSREIACDIFHKVYHWAFVLESLSTFNDSPVRLTRENEMTAKPADLRARPFCLARPSDVGGSERRRRRASHSPHRPRDHRTQTAGSTMSFCSAYPGGGSRSPTALPKRWKSLKAACLRLAPSTSRCTATTLRRVQRRSCTVARYRAMSPGEWLFWSMTCSTRENDPSCA